MEIHGLFGGIKPKRLLQAAAIAYCIHTEKYSRARAFSCIKRYIQKVN